MSEENGMRTRVIAAVLFLLAAMVVAQPTTAQAIPAIYPSVTSLKLTAVGSTTMTIAWKGNNYPNARNRYRIGWVEQEWPYRAWESKWPDYGQGASPATLTGLLAAHHYEITVTARAEDDYWPSFGQSFEARTLG